MRGIENTTGKALEGLAHLKQSLETLLSTPIGTRVMRRDYGSKLPRLVDAPMNQETKLDVFAATAEAIQKWEPRFDLKSTSIASSKPGELLLDLTGTYLPEGKEVTLEGVRVTA